MSSRASRLEFALPLALGLVLGLVYLSSLGGGFLNYDDPWLIRDNALLHDGSARALGRILFDGSRETRLALGAEYFPLRDLVLWVELNLLSASPQALRVVQLAIYVAGCLSVRHALRSAWGPGLAAEAAAWVFALHPVHAEAVAWLAGLKDVLALAFVGGALAAYGSSSKRAAWWAPVLLLCAHFSRNTTVTALGLLLAHDLLAKRAPRWPVLGAALGVALLAVAVHMHVASLVGMSQPPHGGSRLATAATMGVVWLKYLSLLAWPTRLSVVQDAEILQRFTASSLLGWALLLAWGALALVVWRRERRSLPLVTWMWLVVPLLPVSHVLFPFQNLMADRYLLLPAMVPALALGALVAGLARPAARATVVLATSGLSLVSSARAVAFADSVSLFRDATAKTSRSAVAPFQLGAALEETGDRHGARAAYEEALRRDGLRTAGSEEGRRATNNLAKLLVALGELEAAEAVLRAGRARWPDDPKILSNLVKVTARRGGMQEARQLFEELRARFPSFAPE